MQTEPICGFVGEYRFLSSFWPARVRIPAWVIGKDAPDLDAIYPTIEHAYQAAKSPDPEVRRHIRECTLPGNAKRAGQSIDVRDGWEVIKVLVMRELVSQKFADPDLREKLMATGRVAIEETNTWGDQFWGRTVNLLGVHEGKNMLGRLLMTEREVLQWYYSKFTNGAPYGDSDSA